MSRPEAVVFDNDGLLLDTEDAWTRAERALFVRHGSAFTRDHKRQMIGSSHLIAAGHLERMLELPGQGLQLMAELHQLVMEEVTTDVEPMPGAVKLVGDLVAASIPIGLATNSPRAFCERALRAAGLEDVFAAVVCADDVEHPKPAPDVYLEACRRLDADPARSVALEDSPTGASAAFGAGMHVVGVPSLPDMPLPAAHIVASSLSAPEVRAACGL